MRRICLVVIAMLASGCERPEVERHMKFACDNTEQVEVTFKPQTGSAVLLRNGDLMELRQQPAASGFHYSNGPYAIRGKGDELIVEVGRMVPLQCKAL